MHLLQLTVAKFENSKSHQGYNNHKGLESQNLEFLLQVRVWQQF
jgi:hypothetical protein